MTPKTRIRLSLIPLLAQGLATFSGIQTISFFLPTVSAFLKDHESKVAPAPTLLLIEHASAAKLILLGLFAVSVLTFFVTRAKLKDEADRLAVQGAVYGMVWYAGIIYVGGVLMAAALPYFALNSQ